MAKSKPFFATMADALAEIPATAVPTAHRAVLLALARYARPDGSRCYPSGAVVRATLGMSPRTWYRVLRELEAALWIARRPQTREEGGQTSSLYVLHLRGGPIQRQDRRIVRGVVRTLPEGVADLDARRKRNA